MGLTAVLDTVIGLCFAYFLLALFSSWAYESVAARLNQRGKYLFAGLREMLQGDAKVTDMLDKFVRHPLIESLDKVRQDKGPSRAVVDADATNAQRLKVFPSYLPPATVATVLLDVISPTGGASRFADARAHIDALPDSKLKDALKSIAARADSDIEALRKGVEEWYSSTMDRVTGWYKAYAQRILLVFGLVFALAFNVDTFKMVRELWSNPAARAAAVQAATSATVISESQDVRKTLSDIKQADSAEKKKEHYDKLLKQLDVSRNLGKPFDDAEGSAIPVGWRTAHFTPFKHCNPFMWPFEQWVWWSCTSPVWDHIGIILLKLAGIFITGCAVALGAPFWFELMGKLVDLRKTGRKPEEK